MLQFLTDPILRGPTVGCMLMAISAGLVGVIAFLRKRSLVGEALSHASYPGVILALFAASAFFPGEEGTLSVFLLIGAFIFALTGLFVIHGMERFLKISPDAALCFVLATFFGVGLTLASRIQFTHVQEYRQILVFLYGQAATMTDIHIVIYGALALVIIAVFLLCYKELLAVNFDPEFSKAIGLKVLAIEGLVYFLIVLAIVIGIRSVGVVLMSAMLIGPAVAARQLTQKLSLMLFYAALFGAASGFFGNYFSLVLSQGISASGRRFSLPTGPMIVLVSSVLCLLSLCFAPQRGLCFRLLRIVKFRWSCFQENLLKALWRFGSDKCVTREALKAACPASALYLRFSLWRLQSQGWLFPCGQNQYRLSRDGYLKASRIVRLHRLWEVYLCDYLGMGAEKVHHSAEEMEHILTPQLEEALTQLLHDPKSDPHAQPIPPKEGL